MEQFTLLADEAKTGVAVVATAAVVAAGMAVALAAGLAVDEVTAVAVAAGTEVETALATTFGALVGVFGMFVAAPQALSASAAIAERANSFVFMPRIVQNASRKLVRRASA